MTPAELLTDAFGRVLDLRLAAVDELDDLQHAGQAAYARGLLGH